jgi:hypothetical protein
VADSADAPVRLTDRHLSLMAALAELEVERRGGGSLTPAQIREARVLVLGAELEELEALGVRLVEALTRRWTGDA